MLAPCSCWVCDSFSPVLQVAIIRELYMQTSDEMRVCSFAEACRLRARFLVCRSNGMLLSFFAEACGLVAQIQKPESLPNSPNDSDFCETIIIVRKPLDDQAHDLDGVPATIRIRPRGDDGVSDVEWD